MRLICLSSLLFLSGCSSLNYYLDGINGHLDVLAKSKDIESVINDPKSSDSLIKQLRLTLEVRAFASRVLKLPENNSYRSFADLKRDFVVWNVIAAPEFSIQPRQWCFFWVGCLNYRGYFSKDDAEGYADELRRDGFDVYVGGVRAYSTLGWTDDPLLNTMLYKEPVRLAALIFHELAHQQVYIKDDSSFNESFATAVEMAGVQRWLNAQGDMQAYQRYQTRYQFREAYSTLVQQTREQLNHMYRQASSVEKKRTDKVRILQAFQTNLIELSRQHNDIWKGHSWLETPLNNAHLSLVATYHTWVPAFMYLLEKVNGDLDKFYKAVEELGDLSITQRSASLELLNIEAIRIQAQLD